MAEAAVQVRNNESPHQLDPAQVLKASTALLGHLKSAVSNSKQSAQTKRNLLTEGHDSDADDDAAAVSAEPVWLIVSTKKHISDQKRLKPGKVRIPHSLNTGAVASICLIVPDPQRAFKDVLAHPSFPNKPLAAKIRVLGVSKIKTRYQQFENRRQLLAEHDMFLADDRIVPLLPKLLGKTFFSTAKRPLPVSLEGKKVKDSHAKAPTSSLARKQKRDISTAPSISSPAAFSNELERALSSAQIHMSQSSSTAVRIGLSSFTPQQIADNISSTVNGLTDKYIPQGWRNVKSMHIKGPNSVALPLWVTNELWLDREKDVVADEEALRIKELESSQKGNAAKRKRGQHLLAESGHAMDPNEDRSSKKRITIPAKEDEEEGMSKEMRERRERLRQAKVIARHEAGT